MGMMLLSRLNSKLKFAGSKEETRGESPARPSAFSATATGKWAALSSRNAPRSSARRQYRPGVRPPESGRDLREFLFGDHHLRSAGKIDCRASPEWNTEWICVRHCDLNGISHCIAASRRAGSRPCVPRRSAWAIPVGGHSHVLRIRISQTLHVSLQWVAGRRRIQIAIWKCR